MEFRVWDQLLEKHFFEGFKIDSHGTLVECGWYLKREKKSDKVIKNNMAKDGEYHEDKMPKQGFVVERSIGRKDKNKIKIYQNDKIKYWNINFTDYAIHRVMWDDNKIGWVLSQESLLKDNLLWMRDWDPSRAEVVGHIHNKGKQKFL